MIRNFLFSIFFYFGIILISIIFLPSFFLPQKVVLVGGKLMGFWAGLCLKTFLSTKIVIKGKENIICNEKFLIASSHQSMFETFFLQTIFNSPVFILKKELLKIPIFGWHLKKIGSISIDRDKINRENLGFYDKIISITKKTKRPIIIFPQSTRTPINEKIPFKKGVSKIYERLNFVCVPVALNSGNVWPKSGLINSNRTITVSILKLIPTGLDTSEFQKEIEKVLYNELEEII